MKFIVPKTDLRGDNGGRAIIDAATKETVGAMTMGKNFGRHIAMFGGKYEGWFETQKECEAFVKGVEAVLNHVVSVE